MSEYINNKENYDTNKISVSSSFVTIFLIAANVIVWIILQIMGDTESAQYMYEHGAMYPNSILLDGEYWRFFTAAFLHFGVMHLANNMIILACAGPYVEHALGHFKYFILYILAAVASNMLSYYEMIKTGNEAVSAGASGAIFGVLAALLWIVIRNKGNYETLTTKGMIFMIAMSLYYGISTAGVDNWSHIGGLIIGFIICMILYQKNK